MDNTIKFFGELELNIGFTYYLWQQGDAKFTKTGRLTAKRDSTGETYRFTYNDNVRVLEQNGI